MKTLAITFHPLEMAYTAAKELTFLNSQIYSLRQLAVLYGKLRRANGHIRSIEILDEARQLQQRLVRNWGNMQLWSIRRLQSITSRRDGMIWLLG